MSRLLLRHVASHMQVADAQSSLSDAELLERFAATHDERACTELVTRHGDLVHGTAHRCLNDRLAAEDVFQATFLLLARKAGSVRWQATVGPGADACPLPGHTFTICNSALSPDGKIAVTAGWDNALKWWDADKGRELRSVSVPDGITAMTVSPEFKTVLVATEGGKLRTWDAATGRETISMNLPDGFKVECFTFTPDGKHVIAAAGPKITVWEWPALKLVRTIEIPRPEKRDQLPENSEHRCIDVAVSPDGKWLVTVARRPQCTEHEKSISYLSEGGVVDVWEFASGKRVRRLAESTMSFRCGIFTGDGQFILIRTKGLISGGETRQSQSSAIQDVLAEGNVGTIPAEKDRDTQTFAGEINVLDPVAGRFVRSFDVPPPKNEFVLPYFNVAVLSPDGRTLYVASSMGKIIEYDVATGKPRRTFSGHQGYVSSLAVSADGRRLISGGRDGLALVWDVTPDGVKTPPK